MYRASSETVSSCIAMKGSIFSCHSESDIAAGTLTSKLMETYPALSATFLKRAVTLEAFMTSVATISPVSVSFMAFMIIGSSDNVLLILSICTSLSSSSSIGGSSGTESVIPTAPERIFCIFLYGEQESATPSRNNIKSTFLSEHIRK